MEDYPINLKPAWRKMKMRIFSFLPQKSRQMIRGVCREWKQMVDEMPCAVINNENYEATTQLTDLYIVKVQNFSRELQTAVKFKTTIRRLEFWDIVVSYNLFHLLQECLGVRELIFGNVTLDSHKKIKCPEDLNLPEVKVITFRTKGYVRFTVQELILLDLLCQIKFEKLEQVIVPDRSQWPNYDHNAMLAELRDPPKIELPFRITSSGFVKFLVENGKTIKKLKIEAVEFRPFGCEIELFMDQIDELQIADMMCSIWEAGECQVIEHQKKLKEIEVEACYDCWPSLSSAFQASSSTLTKIDIYFGAFQLEWQPQDASVFKDCSKLESLSLKTGSAILNLAFLPDGIQFLTLRAQFNTEDLLAIASKLCNLRVVEFELHQFSIINQENVFFSNEIIEAFLGIETLVRLLAYNFGGVVEEVAKVSKSQDAFQFSHVFYQNSTMTLEIRTLKERALHPTHIPIGV